MLGKVKQRLLNFVRASILQLSRRREKRRQTNTQNSDARDKHPQQSWSATAKRSQNALSPRYVMIKSSGDDWLVVNFVESHNSYIEGFSEVVFGEVSTIPSYSPI